MEAFHEAAHSAFAFEMGLKIVEIRMKPDAKGTYSAAVATEDRKRWVQAAEEADRRGHAEEMIRMLMAAKAAEEALGSTDPQMNFRALRDDVDITYFRRTYIPESEQKEVMDRLLAEVKASLTDAGSPMRQAIAALAVKLIETGDNSLGGDEVREILQRFLEPPTAKSS
jgi:maltooligosyltrehalose synthase